MIHEHDTQKQAKQEQASASKQDKQAIVSKELPNILVRIPDDSKKYSWESYFATDDVDIEFEKVNFDSASGIS